MAHAVRHHSFLSPQRRRAHLAPVSPWPPSATVEQDEGGAYVTCRVCAVPVPAELSILTCGDDNVCLGCATISLADALAV